MVGLGRGGGRIHAYARYAPAWRAIVISRLKIVRYNRDAIRQPIRVRVGTDLYTARYAPVLMAILL